MSQGWITAYQWALIIGATAQTLFVIVYGTRKWWKHYVGKALFFKALTLCVALWVSFTNIVLDPYKYQIPIAVGAIWLVTLAIVGQTIALFLQVGHDLYDKKLKERERQHTPE